MERGEINRGNLVPGTAENYEEWEALKQKVFFHEYLLRYLGRYGQEKQDSPLWYQTEYVIVGKDNDTDNLKGIVNRIFVIREAANTMYLTGSEEKRGNSGAIGRGTCSGNDGSGDWRVACGDTDPGMGFCRKCL